MLLAAAACGGDGTSGAARSAPASADEVGAAATPAGEAAPEETEPPVPETAEVVAAAPDPVVAMLYPVVETLRDPYRDAPPKPTGVRFATERVTIEGRSREARVASVAPKKDETLDVAITRVLPWFNALSLPPEHRIGFDMPRRRGFEGVKTARALVLGAPIVTLHASDLASARVRDAAQMLSVEIVPTPDARARIRAGTEAYVDSRVAWVVDDRIVWTPQLGAPVAAYRPEVTLCHLHGDRAFGDTLVTRLRGEGAAPVAGGGAAPPE